MMSKKGVDLLALKGATVAWERDFASRLALLAGAVLLATGRVVDLRWHATHPEFETGLQQVQAHWLAWLGALVLLASSSYAVAGGLRTRGFRIVLGSAIGYAAVAVWHFQLHQAVRDPALPHVLLVVSQIGLFTGIALELIVLLRGRGVLGQAALPGGQREDGMPAADAFAVRMEEFGLYDPSALDADGRLALLRFAADQGVEPDELRAADRLGRLPYAAGDPHIRPGRQRLTLAEVAARADVDTEDVISLWRDGGLPTPPQGEAVASEADITLVRLWRTATAFLGERPSKQLLRTMGACMATIAEAESSIVAARVGQPLMQQRDLLGLAHTNVAIAQLLPDVAQAMDVLHRHHIELSIHRWLLDPATRESEARPASVGFADLRGFTHHSAELHTDDLAQLINRFEEIVSDRVTAGGGRIVKLIGDEAMFVAGDMEAGAQIALSLAEADFELPLRVGFAHGDVLMYSGDYYGTTVNLAARLVDSAEPGTVLVPADTAKSLSKASTLRRRQHRTIQLKGLGPIDVCHLERIPHDLQGPNS